MSVRSVLSTGHGEPSDLRPADVVVAGLSGNRPARIRLRRHLRLAFHDIAEPIPGLTAPDREMMQAMLDFGGNAKSTLAADPLLGRDQSLKCGGICHRLDRNRGFQRDIAIEFAGDDRPPHPTG